VAEEIRLVGDVTITHFPIMYDAFADAIQAPIVTATGA
jgi:hypothetical protein